MHAEHSLREVKMAGCVLAVSLSSSSVPSKHIFEIEKPAPCRLRQKRLWLPDIYPPAPCPCPGIAKLARKDECNFAHRYSLSRTVTRDRGGGELLFNFLVHARAGKSRSYANGVFHGVGVRTPMTDHTNAADAQQRRAAVLRISIVFLAS